MVADVTAPAAVINKQHRLQAAYLPRATRWLGCAVACIPPVNRSPPLRHGSSSPRFRGVRGTPPGYSARFPCKRAPGSRCDTPWAPEVGQREKPMISCARARKVLMFKQIQETRETRREHPSLSFPRLHHPAAFVPDSATLILAV